ncbi:MAG: KEOPS complex kinase/ATPase Bud32 [Nitrososphaeria archaeon]
MEKLIKVGAEANIYLDNWDGIKVVRKTRRPKPYWKKELDDKIRRTRTIREAQFLTSVKELGVLTPIVYFVDPFLGEIIMEYVDGVRVKDLLNMDSKTGFIMLYEAGKGLAKMHKHNIIHGDPTTSNFIMRDRKLYFIDFGLAFYSTRLEDKAVDLHLLKQVIKSAHPEVFSKGFKMVIEGYQQIFGIVKPVLDNIKEIERRGRYATLD